jgi:hypothetical protein
VLLWWLGCPFIGSGQEGDGRPVATSAAESTQVMAPVTRKMKRGRHQLREGKGRGDGAASFGMSGSGREGAGAVLHTGV